MKPDHPRVTVTVGQSVIEFQKNSTYRFSFENQNDNSPFVVETPVLLEYGQGASSLSFPPGTYLWISQLGGRVYEVQFSPHLEALSWEQALQLCFALLDRLKASPWKPEVPEAPSEQELRENFDAASRELYAATVQTWRLKTTELRLTLKRLRKPEEPDDQEAFMVLLTISDDALQDVLMEQVTRRRQESGSPDDPLPLEEWLKQPR